jgi:N-glycosylase/DNA lyase
MDNLKEKYKNSKDNIKSRLQDFSNIKEGEYLYEFLFCLLTPQSNAKKCWSAVEEIKKLREINKSDLVEILKTRTRFHNNKANYIIKAIKNWLDVKEKIAKAENIVELRNWLAENIQGMGYKEASHFLRNIGKSNNEIAILDRHILRNLKSLGAIETDKIKNKKHYFALEQKFITYSNNIEIPIDHLDLLFWSNETGEIFK